LGFTQTAASIDLGSDGRPDVLLNRSAYGNHGNGTESYWAFVNDWTPLDCGLNPAASSQNQGKDAEDEVDGRFGGGQGAFPEGFKLFALWPGA
jgi:hypothetical protein